MRRVHLKSSAAYDYTITHPDAAQHYSELNQKLAKQYSQDIEEYRDGKDEVVKTIEKKY